MQVDVVTVEGQGCGGEEAEGHEGADYQEVGEWGGHVAVDAGAEGVQLAGEAEPATERSEDRKRGSDCWR